MKTGEFRWMILLPAVTDCEAHELGEVALAVGLLRKGDNKKSRDFTHARPRSRTIIPAFPYTVFSPITACTIPARHQKEPMMIAP